MTVTKRSVRSVSVTVTKRSVTWGDRPEHSEPEMLSMTKLGYNKVVKTDEIYQVTLFINDKNINDNDHSFKMTHQHILTTGKKTDYPMENNLRVILSLALQEVCPAGL